MTLTDKWIPLHKSQAMPPLCSGFDYKNYDNFFINYGRFL